MSELSDLSHVKFPISFIEQLSRSEKFSDTMDCIAHWTPKIIEAERASICLKHEGGDQLVVYAFAGNKAIPTEFRLPPTQSTAGKAFLSRQLIVTTGFDEREEVDVQMLAQSGLTSCVNAPLIKGSHCFGTLNVAHSRKNAYQHEATTKLMQALADWVASHVYFHYQITEQKRLARTDPLTGIANRRHSFDRGERWLTDWKSKNQPFSLVLIDIDRFKRINDQHGHAAGDMALTQFSESLRSLVRSDDVFSRIGGEEFMIVLRNTDAKTAVGFAERLRGVIESLEIGYLDLTIHITASIGVTEVCKEDTSFEDTYSRADKALYHSKGNGRNQVNVY